MKKVSIVIPTFNEQENVSVLAKALLSLDVFVTKKFEATLIFVDDGSSDESFKAIQQLRQQHSEIHYVKLSKNCGHQNALRAGLELANGDAIISMDADMQHPPELVPKMLALWEQGFDVVYTKREDTEGTGALKNLSSKWFYKIINMLSEVKLEEGTADFRLIDKKILAIVKESKQVEVFFRAYIKSTGFKQTAISYNAAKRNAGSSKFTFKKMLRLALIGITSFSVKPLHFATYLGVLLSFVSLLFLPYVLYGYFFDNAVSGWTSLIVTVVFFGGLQLFVLGIIGIYIGKIFIQVKQQPQYYIEETSLFTHEG
jgi:polyisoprenyl-phosphate glycosyltransferase